MRLIVPCLLLAMFACASSTPDGPARTGTQTVRIVDGVGNITAISTDATLLANMTLIELAPEQAWAGLIVAYEEMGLPIANLDSGTRSIGANFRTRGRVGNVRLSTYLDCGRTQGGPSADTYDVHLLVESRIIPGDLGTSHVGTAIEATARPSSFAANPVRCSSTGTMEQRIVGHIRRAAWGNPSP